MKKKGLALVVIIFFGFCMSVVLYALVSSNSNLKFQNNNAIRELQAYYLGVSAIQHAKLYIKLLPKEVSDEGVSYLTSKKIVGNQDIIKNDKFTLLNNSFCKGLDKFPFSGGYSVKEIKKISGDSVQASYDITVSRYLKSERKHYDREDYDDMKEKFTISTSAGDFYYASYK